jgi:Protein of unknown function (DUF3034)
MTVRLKDLSMSSTFSRQAPKHATRCLMALAWLLAVNTAWAGDRLLGNLTLRATRAKPDRLSAFKEENAWDAFVAWFPHRNLSLTAAWLELGNIADKPNQRSLYLSAQVGF